MIWLDYTLNYISSNIKNIHINIPAQGTLPHITVVTQKKEHIYIFLDMDTMHVVGELKRAGVDVENLRKFLFVAQQLKDAQSRGSPSYITLDHLILKLGEVIDNMK